jgi:hypothetical protein
VKTAELTAVPPGVVIAIFPVFAPVGTLAVTNLSELTVNVVAFTPPNVTLVVCMRLTPVIITGVPTLPLGGLKPVILGVTRNCLLLVNVVVPVVTVTDPVSAPVGTVAEMKLVAGQLDRCGLYPAELHDRRTAEALPENPDRLPDLA